MVASSAGARTAPRFLRLSESWRRTQETAFKEITRSAPAEKRPHGDDGWGEFVRSPDPAAEKRRGRRLDCSSLSFLFHHEAAGGRPRREARAPCDVISQSAKERQHQVIGLELDIGRDREAATRFQADRGDRTLRQSSDQLSPAGRVVGDTKTALPMSKP